MLRNKSVIPTLPVVDLQRARQFYEEKLGLGEPAVANDNEVQYSAGPGASLYLYRRDQSKADHTAFAFLVEDVEQEVKELKDKGVVFEEYDMPELQTVNSIASMGPHKSAWFKDTEGNIIAIASL